MSDSIEYKLSDYDQLRKKLIEKLGAPVYPSWQDAFKIWEQRTNSMPPMSFIYVYDYKQLRTVLSKGFGLLGYSEKTNFDYKMMGGLMHPNQKKILFLQTMFMAFESHKFTQFAKGGNLIRTTLRAYKDSSGKYWLGQQTIEYFQNDESDNLVRYLAWVHILGEYNGEPLKTRFYTKRNLNDKETEKFNYNIKIIRTAVFEQLGFTNQQMEVIKLLMGDSSPKDVCATMRIKESTLRYHRLGILEKGREIFPKNEFKSAKDVIKYLEDQQII